MQLPADIRIDDLQCVRTEPFAELATAVVWFGCDLDGCRTQRQLLTGRKVVAGQIQIDVQVVSREFPLV